MPFCMLFTPCLFASHFNSLLACFISLFHKWPENGSLKWAKVNENDEIIHDSRLNLHFKTPSMYWYPVKRTLTISPVIDYFRFFFFMLKIKWKLLRVTLHERFNVLIYCAYELDQSKGNYMNACECWDPSVSLLRIA